VRRLRSGWLRYPDEATECPGCASPRFRLLDVLQIPRDIAGRRTLFLSVCDACGLLFANPVPSAEQLACYYAEEGPYRTHTVRAAEAHRVARKGNPRAKARPLRAADRLLDALTPFVPVHNPPPDAKVLDFGCGEGKFLDRLQDRGWRTYGIEPSTTVAFRRHQRLMTPPQDGSFDFVILHHVLEHVTEPLAVLQQVGGALREGGVLFISLPSLDSLPRHRLLRYCVDGRKHLIAFSETCLAGYLARAGFELSARLDSCELDQALTKGQPLRLRVIATRTSTPPPPPPTPSVSALVALRRYHRTNTLVRRIEQTLPVRLRAALMDGARERKRRRERQRE
jgi:2-polyprenyl-3-methyl-5-hydroxy-6-metoxy-1,4-benzoquinol methylase